jgi:hypothetical protein
MPSRLEGVFVGAPFPFAVDSERFRSCGIHFGWSRPIRPCVLQYNNGAGFQLLKYTSA